MKLKFSIDPSWTLFLDRDGVINKQVIGDYIRRAEDFEFLPGVVDTIVQCSILFSRIIVVTNQQGVGKGLYSHEELAKIHEKMKKEIEDAGGKIDAVFYAPQLKSENSPMRKPGIGMALQAKKIFPEIEFSKSIMVGDSSSDMEFAKRAGMKTVFVGTKEDPGTAVDAKIDTLTDFLAFLSR